MKLLLAFCPSGSLPYADQSARIFPYSQIASYWFITEERCWLRFGDTSEPWEHLALSVYRTVELRTEMVRAVNTGVSAYVDATGKIHARTYLIDPVKDPRGADKILAEVALLEGGYTVYAAVGDLFGYLNLIITLYLWLVLPRLRRRKASGLLKRSV